MGGNIRYFTYKYNILYDDWFNDLNNIYITRCTRGVRVVFSVTRMRSNNSARINKSDFTTEKIVTVFEIVARHNVVN